MFKALVLTTAFLSVAQAADITLYDAPFNQRHDRIETRLVNGAVEIHVTRERCMGSDNDICRDLTVFKQSFPLAGLVSEGEELSFLDDSGRTVCGVYGTSRVLRLPVLRLTGDCSVSAKTPKINSKRRLIVKFQTR
jgi:hypothetical protein